MRKRQVSDRFDRAALRLRRCGQKAERECAVAADGV
jgi:hypothetical protein